MRPLDDAYNPGKSQGLGAARRHGAGRHRHGASGQKGQSGVRPESTYSGGAPVLYIHPAKQGPAFIPQFETGRPYGLIPLGLPALVNTLRSNGVEVKGVIHPLESDLDPGFSLEQWLSRQAGAQIILIDLHWYEHCYGAVETARLCKKVLPGAWTVLGGLSASGFAAEILADYPAVDFIIRGDAEQPLLALVQRLLSGGTRAEIWPDLAAIPNLSYRDGLGAASQPVVETPITYVACTADLDNLDFIDLTFIEHHQAYLVHEYNVSDLPAAQKALEAGQGFQGRWTCTARGCKFHCSYCGGSKESHQRLAGRDGIVPRSPERVVEDLRRLSAQGVQQASLSYDVAILGEDYWRTLFAQLRDSGVQIGIYNEFFQLPGRACIEDYARSVAMPHSCVALSPLSGSEQVRRLNGKLFSNEALFDILDALSQERFYLFVYFSLNLPGETTETFAETLDLARSIYDFYPASRLKILNTVHTLDPVSPMNLYPEKYGIQAGMRTFQDFYQYCANTRQGGPGARTELLRGFTLNDPAARSLENMATAWDRAREGKEKCWFPVPQSW